MPPHMPGSTADVLHQRPDWKSRYQQVRDEFDAHRRRWGRDENRIQRAILRLALSFGGSDEDFDALLLRLRHTLRQRSDEQTRRDAIEGILDAMSELAERRAAHPLPAWPGLDPLFDRLARLPLPAEQAGKLAELRGRLQSCTPAPEPGPVLEQVFELLEPALAGDRAAGADPFTALLERLELNGEYGLQINQLRRQVRLARSVDEKLALVDATVQLLGAAADTRRSGRLDIEALTVAEIAAVLRQLLDWMCLPRSVAARADALRDRLAEGLQESEITAVLKEIAAIVGELRARLEAELANAEEFLHELTGRIADVDAQLRAAVRSQESVVDDGQHLQRTMNAELQALRSEVRHSDDLGQLRRIAEARLDSISRSLGEFSERQRRHLDTAGASARGVEAQMRGLKTRAENLQSALASERRRALVDPLTGIGNRRALEHELAAQWRRWRRGGTELALAIIDLDEFKAVNDTYGHRAGDKVLSSVAALCAERLRTGDFIARYGGEEFVLLLPDTGLDGAHELAEALRAQVGQCRFHYRGTPVPVTLSAGIACFRAGNSPGEVIERADRALYLAKSGGRNRSVDERALGAAA